MDCFICHRSNWMQEKCLDFPRNLLPNQTGRPYSVQFRKVGIGALASFSVSPDANQA